MKKIALIYYHPINSIDGASKVVKSFKDNADIIKNNGVLIDIFAPTSDWGVTCDETNMLGRLLKFIKNFVFMLDFAGVLRMVYNLYIRSENAVKLYKNRSGNSTYDAVFIHDLLTCYRYLKSGDGKPVLLVMHTTGDLLSMTLTYYPLLRYTVFYNIILKKVIKTVLSNVSRIVFNSKLAADNFYKLYPNVKPNIASFVNNGIVDLSETERSHHMSIYPPYNFVCVGSISERKGQRFIIEALKKCTAKERAKFKFIFVGDGEIRRDLEGICERAGLSNNIEFCGLQKDIVPFLKKSNIFILPSIDEGMPISILEAMRQGLPVVSTRVGGIPYQVIDGKTGVLINASISGVYNFLMQVDEYDWAMMGRESRLRYEQEFGVEQMMNKYSELLYDICSA